MRGKSILALAVALAMIFSVIPAFGLTASAADPKTLFDISTVEFSGETNPSSGMTTSDDGVKFNAQWSAEGVWQQGTEKSLMFFRTGAKQNGNAETKTATFSDAAQTKDANKITIEYKFASQTGKNNYQTWDFVDNSGRSFAKVYYDIKKKATVGQNGGDEAGDKMYAGDNSENGDKADEVAALMGKAMKIEAAKQEEGNWKVTYYSQDSSVGEETVDSIDGIASIKANIGQWNDQYAAMGLVGLKVTYEIPETVVEVTATYKVNGTEVAKETATYDTAKGEAYVTFPEKYVYHEGEVYYAAAQTLSASQDVDMTVAEHYSSKEIGDKIIDGGKVYEVEDNSIVVNGNFAVGAAGWTNRKGTAFTGAVSQEEVNGEQANVITLANAGGSATDNFGQVWELTPNQAYYIAFDIANVSNSSGAIYASLIPSADAGAARTAATGNISSDGGDLIKEWVETPDWKKYEVVYTATDEAHYMTLAFSWMAARLANIEILPVKESETKLTEITVNFKNDDGTTVKTVTESVLPGESVKVEEQEVYVLGDGYYNIPATETSESKDVTVSYVENKYGVKKDVYINETNKVKGAGTKDSNHVFVASGGGDTAHNSPHADADGVPVADGTHTPSQLGSARIGLFDFGEIKLSEGQRATLVLPVSSFHDQAFANGNTSIRFTVYAQDDSSWTELEDDADYTRPEINQSIEGAMFSNAVEKGATEVKFDVTEAVKAAEGKAFEVRAAATWGAAYYVDSETAVDGEANAARAAYVLVTDDGVNVTVADADKVTRNGDLMSGTSFTAKAGDTVKVYTDKAAVYDGEKVTKVENGAATFTVEKAMNLECIELGVSLVNGAQVRLGKSYAGNIAEDSGLRFIGTVDKDTTTVASLGSEISIRVKITPKDKPETNTEINIEKYQDAPDNTLFTAVITNLNKDNYNRVFTATVIATIDGVEYTGNTVERSIFEVAAGILVEGSANTTDGLSEYTIVADVLNTYVQAVGVRFAMNKDTGVVDKANDYNLGGEALTVYDVEVTPVAEADKTYKVVITPQGGVKLDPETFKDTIRINNNNSAVKNGIEALEITETSASFTFVVANAVAAA